MLERAMDIEEHLTEFVEAFVISSRKERWKTFLSKRSARNARHSSLIESLDSRYSRELTALPNLEQSRPGVYYDFYEEPVIVSVEEAAKRGHFNDAIFSITAGKLAICFWHEGPLWLCQR
jgi:hypothetical protein